MNYKKTYYSYSRLWKYLRDPQEYYRCYVLKMWDAPNAPMVLGTIFASAYAGQKFADTDPKLPFDFKKAIANPQKYVKNCPDDVSFTPDYARVMEKVLKDKKLVKLASKFCEQTVRVESKICPLMAKHDGREPNKKGTLIIENKYGSCWTEERANTDDQITFYSYVDWLLTGIIPTVIVQTCDKKSGKITVFEVKKTIEQFAPLVDKIEHAYNGIINEVWERMPD